MSFSFTLFEHEVETTTKKAVDDKVAALLPADGKDEAEMLSGVISDAIDQLSRGEVEFGSAYVTGNITDRKAQLNVNVSFKMLVETEEPFPVVPPAEKKVGQGKNG